MSRTIDRTGTETTENAGTESPTVRVWDPLIRVFHWCLVAVVLVGYAISTHRGNLPHEVLGYIGGALLTFRVLWGFVGPRYARFSQFVRGPRETIGFALDMLRGRERRYIGHNPAGALMIVALIVVMIVAGVTGFMGTLPAYQHVQWVEDVHGVLANVVLIMVAFHIGGVIHASLHHKENLVRAMIFGRKRVPEADDVE